MTTLHNMTNADYLSDSHYISSSMLGLYRRSVKDFKKVFVDGEEYESDRSVSTDLGTFVHESILEFDSFNNNLMLIDEAMLSKSGSRAGKAWKEYAALPEFEGKYLLKKKEVDHIMDIRRAVLNDDRAAYLLSLNGIPEVTLKWECRHTGLLRRAKYDWLIPGLGWIDIKTSNCIDHGPFFESIEKYGYDRQGAFYRHGYRAKYDSIGDFTIIAVETKKVPRVKCFVLPEEMMHDASQAVLSTLEEIRGRVDTNNWELSLDEMVF